MKISHAFSSIVPFGLVVLVVGLSGCTTAKQPTGPLIADTSPPKIVVTEYEYVTVTGSNIPVRVPKKNGARPTPVGGSLSTMTPEQFEEIQRRGNGVSR